MLIPRTIAAITPIADTDDKYRRFAFSSVQFRKLGATCTATATDGRRLISTTWEPPIDDDANDSEILVNGEDFKNFTKLAEPRGKKRSRQDIQNHVDYVKLEPTNGTTIIASATNGKETANASLPKTFGRYPNCKSVFPYWENRETVSVDLDIKLLRGLLQSMEKQTYDEDESEKVTLTVAIPDDGSGHSTETIKLESEGNGLKVVGLLASI